MSRWLVVTVAALLLVSCDSPDQPISADAEQSCASPGATPICAVKTYHLCTTYADARLCDMIGGGFFAEGREPRKNIPPLEAEPWRISWAEMVKRKDLCGMHVVAAERVPDSRFKSGFTIPENLKGTVEVVLAHDARCQGYEGFDIQSLFLRETQAGWAVSSLDDWSMIKPADPAVSLEGSVCATEEYGPGNGYCSYRVPGIAKYNPEAVRKFVSGL